MFFTKTALAFCGLASLAAGHLTLTTPPRLTSTDDGNGPIISPGTNFPCFHSKSTFAGASTPMALGSQQPLGFTGTAVHGGGSCQISISYDRNPTKSSVWKVIKSFEGGCPAKNTAGNLDGNSAALADPFTYGFSIPDNIPAGNATLAWSWLNRIGNREFYMNCAWVELTGTSGDKTNYDALPNMAVANLPDINSCATNAENDYVFADPGSSVETAFFNPAATQKLDATCTATVAGQPTSGSGSGNGSGSGAKSSPVSSPAAVPTSASLPGGIFITVPTGAATPPPAPQATSVAASKAASPPAAKASTTVAAPAPVPTSGSGSGSGSGAGPAAVGAQTVGSACSPEGVWNCIAGASYQQCGSGLWSAVMPMAAGTKCTPGQSAVINIVATGSKARRAVRFRS